MFAVPLGIVGAGIAAGAKGARSMQNMGGMEWPSLLTQYGPELLVASVVLTTLAVAFRRSLLGALTAIGGGVILYYGMYMQTNVSIMAALTIIGLTLLLLSMLGLRQRSDDVP